MHSIGRVRAVPLAMRLKALRCGRFLLEKSGEGACARVGAENGQDLTLMEVQ